MGQKCQGCARKIDHYCWDRGGEFWAGDSAQGDERMMDFQERINLKDCTPDRDYSCGAAYCDDPACNTHGPKDADGDLLYWKNR